MRSWIGAVSLAAGFLCMLMPVRSAVAQDEEMFNTEAEAIVCQLLRDCVDVTCENDAVVGDEVDDCTYDTSAAQDCLDGLQSLDCDAFSGGSFPSACEEVYDCPPCLNDDELFEEVGEASRGVIGDTFTLCDNVDTSVNRDSTVHSNENVPAKPGSGDHTETRGVVAIETTLDAEQLRSAFGNGAYPCGPGLNGLTVCTTTGGAPLQAGRYIVVQNVVEAAVPRNDPGKIYQYGFVFDADDDESNNYVPSPPFTNDFFRGTDRWYEAVYDELGFWTLTATDARDGNLVSVQSDARLIMKGNTLTLVVPASEFSADPPSYRVTSFCHTGDFGQNPPNVWGGDVEPPVDQPLRQVQDLTADPGTGGTSGGSGTGGTPDFVDDDDGCGCRTVSPSDRSTAMTNALLGLFVTLFITRRRPRHGR